MSLDFAFYSPDGTETLWFHNHWEFFDTFLGEPKEALDCGHDFYVTAPMVTAILGEVETEMARHGMPLTLRGTPEDAVPANFCSAEPEDWVTALPCYRAVLRYLLLVLRANGRLICGWSA
jgi:hypothetical protein